MGEVPADADTLVERLQRGSRRPRLQVIKFDVPMDEVAHRLHASPSGWDGAEHVPRYLAQSVSFAIPASHEVKQAIVRQISNGNLRCAKGGFIDLAVVLDCGVAPNRQIASRGDQPATIIAEKIVISRRWNNRRRIDSLGNTD